MDQLNNRKLLFLHVGEIALFQEGKIAVTIQAADKTFAVFRPAHELFLNAVTHAVALFVRLVPDQFLVVVNEDNTGNRTGFLILNADIVIIRNIKPVSDAHEGDVFILVIMPDHVAVHTVSPVVQGKKCRILRLAFRQPFTVEVRQKVSHTGIVARALSTADPEKLFISPNDARIIQLKNRNREWKIHQGSASGILGIIHDRFQICFQLCLPFSGCYRIDYQQHHHGDGLHRGKDLKQLACPRPLKDKIAEHKRSCRKATHCDQIDARVDIDQGSKILIHSHNLSKQIAEIIIHSIITN